MADHAGVDQVLSIVRGHAEQCLAELIAAGEKQSEAVVEERAGLTLLLILFPTPTSLRQPGLTPCERACVTILAQAKKGQVLSTPQIRDEIEAQQLGIWGETTVKRALRQLRHLGLICSSRRKPKGYWLENRSELFSK